MLCSRAVVSFFRRGLPLVAIVAITAAPISSAHADERGDKAMAEALFRTAKDLKEKGQLAEACPKFAESHRLDPKPGTILNLALCHEGEGKTATAWADFAEAATFASRARQADREKFARGKLDELEKRLSYVTIELAPDLDRDGSLAVTVDAKALTSAALGTRFPIDPGEHTVEARANGRLPWSSKVTVTAGPSDKTITIPNLEVEKTTSPTPTTPRNEPQTPPPPVEERTRGGTQRTLGWVALGVGVAGVGVGGFFGMRTLSEKDEIDAHCVGSFCDAAGLEANDRAKSAATLSTIGFFVGGSLIALGAVLLLTAPSRSSTALSYPRKMALTF